MASEWSRRKTLQLSTTMAILSLAGCSAVGFDDPPQIDSSLGTTAYEPIIDQQPTPEQGVCIDR